MMAQEGRNDPLRDNPLRRQWTDVLATGVLSSRRNKVCILLCPDCRQAQGTLPTQYDGNSPVLCECGCMFYIDRVLVKDERTQARVRVILSERDVA
ncbi:MAG: hypothetical protein C4521_12430 [Actinobacteria bacterium]|nr:MAG: hypothetical protein C4521_12430 [Actinomycetota bacterium]